MVAVYHNGTERRQSMRIGIPEKLGLGCLLAVVMGNAHLNTPGLKPDAGETLIIGDSYTITFNVVAAHGKGTALAVSRDDGNTWTDFKSDYAESGGDNSFKWTVTGPSTTGATAKIRICQGSNSPKPCTDADKTNSLTEAPNGHYVMITPAFTISAAGSAIFGNTAAEPFSIDYRPATRNVDVSFGLTEARDVTLKAFDAQGRLLATLVQGRYQAGTHKLTAFSDKVNASSKSLVFKLTLGNQVRTHLWSGQ